MPEEKIKLSSASGKTDDLYPAEDHTEEDFVLVDPQAEDSAAEAAKTQEMLRGPELPIGFAASTALGMVGLGLIGTMPISIPMAAAAAALGCVTFQAAQQATGIEIHPAAYMTAAPAMGALVLGTGVAGAATVVMAPVAATTMVGMAAIPFLKTRRPTETNQPASETRRPGFFQPAATPSSEPSHARAPAA